MKNRLKLVFSRALALLLVLGIMLCVPAGALAAEYSDVNPSDWFYSYVTDLSNSGVVDGYGDGRFGPTDATTLGAALKLVMLAAGYEAQAPTGSHWASGYLAKAQSLGLLDADDAKNLDGNVSRLTLAKIAARALSMIRSKYDTPFSDVDDGYVTALYRARVLTGSHNDASQLVYKPYDSLTRAEMSAIVWRIRNTDVHANQINAGSYYAEILEGVPQNPYDMGAFVRNGSFMSYEGRETWQGIDVSEYQGNIDWQQVAASGVDFALIRLEYRGYGSTGSLNVDSKFAQNYDGARAAGIKVGVYIFSQAISQSEGAEEARFVLQTLSGRELDYPVMFDWEPITFDTARTDNVSGGTLDLAAAAFCNTVVDGGYTPMVYMSCYVGYTKYDLRKMGWDVCLSQYNDVPDFFYDFKIWQYTDSGSVPGISGSVDMDISFVDYSK